MRAAASWVVLARLHRWPEPGWESMGVWWAGMDLLCRTLFCLKYPCSWPFQGTFYYSKKIAFAFKYNRGCSVEKLILFLIRSCSHHLVHISSCQHTTVVLHSLHIRNLPEEFLSSKDIFYIMPILLSMSNSFPEYHTPYISFKRVLGELE